MAMLTISVPDTVKAWTEAQAGTGRFETPGDYVRTLIEQDRDRRAKVDEMQRLVDAARGSGISTETMADIRDRAVKHTTANR